MADTDRVALLFRLSQTFSSSLDLDEVLNLVMDEVIAAVHAERGFVMLNDADGGLTFRAARGMDQKTIDDPQFQVSRGAVEHVARMGQPILTMDAQKDDRFKERASVMVLGLRSLMCVPLKNKERQLGILYADSRVRSAQFDEDDLELVSAIASTAAIAIDNASLFNDLRQSKLDLEAAYTTTLDGWARAIELRDHETEGHTRRVTEMTVRFARHLGLPAPDLEPLARGALLHDIGKMGVGDGILRKPGPLTAEERAEMEQHPRFAYEMLAPIAFLQSAIDIPYCHHEKWDGSGYPRGLQGEAIPLAARIFCIVDVWDALSQDRYYRKAWPPRRVRDFLHEQAGQHFDPGLVESFLAMLA
jgi:putative nucleotidyltransferase with HDIG domain